MVSAKRSPLCLQALDAATSDKESGKPAAEALHRQKAELLRKLGWEHWAERQDASTLQRFPADYALI